MEEKFIIGVIVGAVMIGIKVIDMLISSKRKPDNVHDNILNTLLWIKEDRKKERDNSIASQMKEVIYGIKVAVDDLHKMHDKTDADGVYLWYVRQSLERAVLKLGEIVERNIVTSDKRNDEIKELVHIIENMSAEIHNQTKATHDNSHAVTQLKDALNKLEDKFEHQTRELHDLKQSLGG